MVYAYGCACCGMYVVGCLLHLYSGSRIELKRLDLVATAFTHWGMLLVPV